MKNELVIGKMNSGKTERIQEKVKKMIESNQSMIILDSKDEYSDLFVGTDYDVKKINIREPRESLGYNPFRYAQEEFNKNNIDKSINIIKNIFDNIFVVDDSRDPFWDNSANDFVTGIAVYLLKTKQELNFKSILRVLKEEQEEFKEYISKTDVLETENLLASPTLYAPKETKGGIVSVAEMNLNLFGAYPNLVKMLCSDDEFELKEENQVIILVNFDERYGVNKVVDIIINQLVNRLYDLKYNYKLILDNYNTLGNKDYFERVFSTCIARNISCLVAVRNIEEIKYISNFDNV